MWSSGVLLGDRYELEEQIGAGGFSEVWRARDLILDRPVAVKLLHADYVQQEDALARFRAEAQHAGSLADENVARVYDYGEPDPPYLVMELIDGPSLSQALASGPLAPVRAMDVVAQAAAGLQAAHLAGLVHRDIKPGNLLLSPGGVVKITDFGISHAVTSAAVTGTGLVVGTPGYLAPERAAGARATPASDLYSLGVVAYECLAGAPPFAGTALVVALAHASRPFPALPGFVPADVAALVTQLTAKEPANRPGSAGEVARRARQLGDRLAAGHGRAVRQPDSRPTAADEPRIPDLPTAPEPREHPSRPGRPAAMAAGVAAALIALVVLIITNTGGPSPAGHPQPASASSASASNAGASSAGASKSPAIVTVDVNVSSLIGQRVSTAVSQLRRQGLVPRVVWQRSDQQLPGRVTAVRPAGQRLVGSAVTVVGALQVAAIASTSHQAGKPHGNGKGNGHGNGNGHGKEKGHGNGNGQGNGHGKG